MHARSLDVAAVKRGERWVLTSPAPGWFVPAVTRGDVVSEGHTIGDLEVLGRRTTLIAPDVQGLAQASLDEHANLFEPRAVAFGSVLAVLDTSTELTATATSTASTHPGPSAAGVVFRAPTSGRFYLRPAPGKPVFVSVGDEIHRGSTICLLEVMKTFNRVTYGGAGLPERAKVKAILVADGADVLLGDALLALE